jgi:predicted 3-demethylubiquinone-9 3-methyltransferase (glyoxalase superfamily)
MITPNTETPMNKVTPFLMFNDQLEAAIEFYTATFPNSEVRNVARTGEEGPISSAESVVGGQLFMGYNGGPYFSFSEGVSLYVDCADQDEVDEYWDKLVKAGAKPTQCGWIKDPFGLSWQICPETIHRADPRQGPQEGEGCDGSHDDDGEARRGGARESL